MHVSCSFEKFDNNRKTKGIEFRTIDNKRNKRHKNNRRKELHNKRKQIEIYC